MRNIMIASALLVAACSGGSPPPPDSGYGADPTLPAPESGGPIPTINIAQTTPWPAGAAPTAPDGFTVTRYAEGLDHPRWLYLLPNGDVLVAQSASRPAAGGGAMGWFRNQIQRMVGAMEQSPDQITLLRDADGDGDVDESHVFAEHLNQPFGMALLGDHIYVGNTDAVVRFAYTPGATSVTGAPETILELPYHAEDNGHWTRNIVVGPGGTKLYVSVGSASNIGDQGMALEEGRAAIWELNPDGSEARVFATGLRNPVGMDWEPVHGALWTAVNERDMLGDNLVPDYMTSVQDGAFYGWPYYYYGTHRDERVEIPANVRLREAISPDYALGSHTASLGLHFYRGQALGQAYSGGVFIGQHGSWNRRVRVGYKVIFVPFSEGRPDGAPQDFLTGFLNAEGEAQGRPVGVIEDRTGAILVADDVGNIVWRVAPTP